MTTYLHHRYYPYSIYACTTSSLDRMKRKILTFALAVRGILINIRSIKELILNVYKIVE